MTKVEAKKQRKREILDANYSIYKSLIEYLIGPKWNGISYQINDVMSKSRAFGIIKIDNGYMGCKCSIYFSTDIRLFIQYRDWHCNEYNSNYTYFVPDKDFLVLQDKIDEYTHRSIVFLRELLRHMSYMDGHTYCLSNLESYEECVQQQPPDDFDILFGEVPLALYEYNWENTEIIDYVIAIMKSKKFKRYRGDNK